jgi:Domain of unknown function (DUF4440)
MAILFDRTLPSRALLAGILAALPAALSGESAAEAAKIVAALDTEYQAAVKNNDAATMDRILAEDFVLVTGRGKTFSKADLLKEAPGQEHALREARRARAEGAHLGRYGRRHGPPVDQGNERR